MEIPWEIILVGHVTIDDWSVTEQPWKGLWLAIISEVAHCYLPNKNGLNYVEAV